MDMLVLVNSSVGKILLFNLCPFVCFLDIEMLGSRLWPFRSNTWLSSCKLQEEFSLPLCRQAIGLGESTHVGWLDETSRLHGASAC